MNDFHFDKDLNLFTINGEDHTLGNLLQNETLKHPSVDFAGYKMPDPIERSIHFRLDTDEDPVKILFESVTSLIAQFDQLIENFEESIR